TAEAADHANHTRARHSGDDLIHAELFQLRLHDAAGARLLQCQLWMSVEVVAPLGHLAMELGNAVDDRHGQVLSLNVRGRPTDSGTGSMPSMSIMGRTSKLLSSTSRRISAGRMRGRNGMYCRTLQSAISTPAGSATMCGALWPLAAAMARTKSA